MTLSPPQAGREPMKPCIEKIRFNPHFLMSIKMGRGNNAPYPFSLKGPALPSRIQTETAD